MSIRIGLYDFFAYALPGVFYLVIIGFWLDSFGLVTLDLKTLNSLSIVSLLAIVGAGYIAGLLVDPLAYRWFRVFKGKNLHASDSAFHEFQRRHPSLASSFRSSDWGLLLRAVKSKSFEAAMDVEQHNVAAIMLRNISLGLVLISICCLVYFFAVSANIWNIFLSALFFALSIVAMRRSELRRRWFYIAVFEAFSAHYLLEDKLINERQIVDMSSNPIDTSTSKLSETEQINAR
jgi:hypothetical protein